VWKKSAATERHVKTFSTRAKGRPGHDLQDGATDRGDVTYTFRLGADHVSFSENCDGATAPALPAGWAASNATGPAPLWVTSSSGTPAPPADTAPNAAFVDDPGEISDKQLQSPSIPIHTASAQLTFRNNYNLEPGFDGGVLEISIDGGAFQDITAAGGSFLTGGYTATVSNSFMNPLGGRPAWSGSSGGLVTTTVKLPAAAAGHNVVLRWRMGSDSSVPGQGWRVDSIQIKDGNECLPLRALTVTKAGAGSGTITSSPAGINCGAACSRNIANGTSVTLTAVPASRSRFAGWSGDCAGKSTCTLTMSAKNGAKVNLTVGKGPKKKK
jgi:hypothetical protein